MMNEQENSLGRFGHHPNPAIDFCIEVDCLEAMAFDRENKVLEHSDFEKRLDAALDFRVGGDALATPAKERLREIKAEGR